ncbi:hypothetical protein Anapl_10562 [Anas platyrhynchos]|uniref:Uncharacterized protein n=1 Tax=Anas platyrhynchos TaxID=8839 RepID=R0KW49_ANAPL|nr:hypothetical protein Anapl_10562 [Anas platyrhynchos]
MSNTRVLHQELVLTLVVGLFEISSRTMCCASVMARKLSVEIFRYFHSQFDGQSKLFRFKQLGHKSPVLTCWHPEVSQLVIREKSNLDEKREEEGMCRIKGRRGGFNLYLWGLYLGAHTIAAVSLGTVPDLQRHPWLICIASSDPHCTVDHKRPYRYDYDAVIALGSRFYQSKDLLLNGSDMSQEGSPGARHHISSAPTMGFPPSNKRQEGSCVPDFVPSPSAFKHVQSLIRNHSYGHVESNIGAASPQKFLSLSKKKSLHSVVLRRNASSGPQTSVATLVCRYGSKPVSQDSSSHCNFLEEAASANNSGKIHDLI